LLNLGIRARKGETKVRRVLAIFARRTTVSASPEPK
jgi:hypothetical protein